MTDWSHRLSMADSQTRAGVLVAALDATVSREAKAELLRSWFSTCDAIGGHRHRLREHFADVDWVTDTDEFPEFPVDVYRGAWEDDDVATALSWTASREKAEWFARYLTSIRASFLGINRESGGIVPVVWQATCTSAFAYFNDRSEQEVVPEDLDDIRPISKLIRVA